MSVGLDRRARRRQETIDEILAIAVEVMATDGVAALSLSEVARRMGLRPPSLYQYFASKMAVYDELFARGMRQVTDVALAAAAGITDPLRMLYVGEAAALRWCMEHQVLAQITFLRPVPGFEPSPEAYAPAVEQLHELRRVLQAAVDAGQLTPAGASDDAVAVFTAITGGIISQQLANEPTAPAGQGRFIRLGPTVIDMFIRYYAPEERGSDEHHRRRSRRAAKAQPR